MATSKRDVVGLRKIRGCWWGAILFSEVREGFAGKGILEPRSEGGVKAGMGGYGRTFQIEDISNMRQDLRGSERSGREDVR